MATDRQIAANQANAQKSTGPKTDAGKAASRLNAVTHGMTAAIVREGEPEYEARRSAWAGEFRPGTPEQAWAADKMVAASFQIDRCQARGDALEREQSARALDAWDDDRSLDAEEAAAKLATNPPLVARRLEATRHGSLLLIGRWERLVEAVAAKGDWSDKERSHALDLLGLPADLRSGRTPLDPEPGVEPAAWLRGLAMVEIDRLRSKNAESHDGLDALQRQLAASGLTADLTKVGQLLRRYEREAWTRYHWGRRVLTARPRTAEGQAPAARPSPRGAVPAGPFDKLAEMMSQADAMIRVRAEVEAEEAAARLAAQAGSLRERPAAPHPVGKNRQQRRAERARARRAGG